MRTFGWAAWLAIAFAVQAQDRVTRPEFTAYQVGPGGGRLWPGRMFSIYGKNLGPAKSCLRNAGPFRPEGPNSPAELEQVERRLPLELCDVQVLIGEVAVPLIYVQEKQINFVVPYSGRFGDRVELRVVWAGVASDPATLQFGPDRFELAQEQPAYAGMPVWVRLYNLSEERRPVAFPLSRPPVWVSPECPHIDVKFNGSFLRELQDQNPPRQFTYSGPVCPTPPPPSRAALAGRIPLHLWYGMERPGTYLVRYIPGSFGAPWPRAMAAEIEWTPVAVKPSTAEQRRHGLLALVHSAPTDHETLLYEFLPSLIGYDDPEALTYAVEYLYRPEAAIATATAGHLRRYYAAAVLIPTLRRIEQRRGANKTVDGLLRDLLVP